MKKQIINFAWMLTVVSIVAGCASTGSSRTDKVESSIEDTRVGLEKAKLTINETLATLDGLQLESTVLADAYPMFQKQVSAIAAAAERLKKDSMDMQEAGQVKFDAWKLELESIQDETIKKTSMKRMEDASKKYEDLLKLLKESETVMDPFVANLTDIVKYLDLDLSPESIKSISGVFGPIKKAHKSGEKVQKWIDNVVEELSAAEGKPAA